MLNSLPIHLMIYEGNYGDSLKVIPFLKKARSGYWTSIKFREEDHSDNYLLNTGKNKSLISNKFSIPVILTNSTRQIKGIRRANEGHYKKINSTNCHSFIKDYNEVASTLKGHLLIGGQFIIENFGPAFFQITDLYYNLPEDVLMVEIQSDVFS